MMSLQCQDAVGKKRSIALNMLLSVRTISLCKRASTWLLVTSMVQAVVENQSSQQFESTFEEADKKRIAPCPVRLLCFGLEEIQANGLTCVGL